MLVEAEGRPRGSAPWRRARSKQPCRPRSPCRLQPPSGQRRGRPGRDPGGRRLAELRGRGAAARSRGGPERGARADVHPPRARVRRRDRARCSSTTRPLPGAAGPSRRGRCRCSPDRWRRPTLASMGEAWLEMAVVACATWTTPAEVADLTEWATPGCRADGRCEGSPAGSWAGPVSLASPRPRRSGISADLGGERAHRATCGEGGRPLVVALRTRPPQCRKDSMDDLEANTPLVDALGDVPVVVRVEIGAARMRAREWAGGPRPGRRGPAWTTRGGARHLAGGGGAEIARGELVEIEPSEVGVRILARRTVGGRYAMRRGATVGSGALAAFVTSGARPAGKPGSRLEHRRGGGSRARGGGRHFCACRSFQPAPRAPDPTTRWIGDVQEHPAPFYVPDGGEWSGYKWRGGRRRRRALETGTMFAHHRQTQRRRVTGQLRAARSRTDSSRESSPAKRSRRAYAGRTRAITESSRGRSWRPPATVADKVDGTMRLSFGDAHLLREATFQPGQDAFSVVS